MNKEIEYYDRGKDYHGIGTFVQLNDLPIKKGDKFIVPSAKLLDGESTSNRKDWVGCSEGRHDHPAYMKPLLLECKSVTSEHIVSVGYGSWRKDLCYVESDTIAQNEITPEEQALIDKAEQEHDYSLLASAGPRIHE